MVRRESKRMMIMFIPECTCNIKLNHVKWTVSRSVPQLDEILNELKSCAEDHEELHTLSRKIVDFIADTGKMQKDDIIEAFPDYNEEQLSIAANMSMYPIIFPKKRHAPFTEFVRLKRQAHTLTEEYRRAKYASINDAKEDDDLPLIEE